MKERPILFSGPMVRAILEGRKTMTRRMVKFVNQANLSKFMSHGVSRVSWCDKPGEPMAMDETDFLTWCPYGVPGDRLWVRETFAEVGCTGWPINKFEYAYRADFTNGNWEGYADMCFEKWKPSIFMPRAASRILLEVTDVRVERLQDITEADAKAEGVEPDDEQGYWKGYLHPGVHNSAKKSFSGLWRSINGYESWDQNPWVWVVEFRKIEQE